jgi:hypothetical protein
MIGSFGEKIDALEVLEGADVGAEGRPRLSVGSGKEVGVEGRLRIFAGGGREVGVDGRARELVGGVGAEGKGEAFLSAVMRAAILAAKAVSASSSASGSLGPRSFDGMTGRFRSFSRPVEAGRIFLFSG